MLNDKKRAEIEQGMAFLHEYYPTHWKQIHRGLIENGFSEQDALDLLKTYISASCKTP